MSINFDRPVLPSYQTISNSNSSPHTGADSTDKIPDRVAGSEIEARALRGMRLDPVLDLFLGSSNTINFDRPEPSSYLTPSNSNSSPYTGVGSAEEFPERVAESGVEARDLRGMRPDTALDSLIEAQDSLIEAHAPRGTRPDTALDSLIEAQDSFIEALAPRGTRLDPVSDPSLGSSNKNDLGSATAPIRAATYNVRYDTGDKTLDEVRELASNNHVFGLQEVKGNDQLGSYADGVFDTHQPYVGSAVSGGQYNPIFYDKNRFEVVYSRAEVLHGKKYAGVDGPSRTANFVVLKERQTGATLLVVNTHFANGNPKAQTHSQARLDEEISEIRAAVPVDGVVVLGDFNRWNPELAGMARAKLPEKKELEKQGVLDDKFRNIDHVLTGGDVFGVGQAEVTHGGESDHNSVGTSFRVRHESDSKARRSGLTNNNRGAILYEDADYGGKRTVVGFGNESLDKTNWNDRTSSIRLGEDTELKVSDHSKNDARFSSPKNLSRTFTDDSSYVGDALNDKISFVRLRKPFP